MAKADLHVHSKYSDYPSTWGHKVYKSPESFTEVDTVYHQAKQRGMDFVTLTDHDDIRGSIELVKKYPRDTFMSCEVTSFFPEDNCKVHILVYGLNEVQYRQIMDIRFNLYQFRDYLLEQDLAHSVAHATYDQDGKLRFEHIEKLVVLFDVFEIINGGSDAQNNLLLHRYLQNLDQPMLQRLQTKYDLQPASEEPWIKGFTAGSDDHCGILIGIAYTQTRTDAIDDENYDAVSEFLRALKRKKSHGNGAHGNFEIYATGVIKHVHDYRLHRDNKYRDTKMNDFLELFFNGDEGNLMSRFKKSRSLRYLKKNNNKTHKALHSLLKQISKDVDQDIAGKIPVIYQQVSELHDELFRSVINALSKHIPSGDVFKGMQKLATVFPMTLLAAPFIGSMRHQILKADIKRQLICGTNQSYTEKALWFTDTIDDLNGVSVTLRQITAESRRQGYQLKLVTCVNQKKLNTPLPSDTLNFHPVKEVELPGYEQQSICFPSLLKMMRSVALEQADQIIISTPGPLGLGALLCAKLMDLPVKMIYHTDFGEQIIRITNEPTLATWADKLINDFYRQANQVFVPSHAYIEKLTVAGLEPSKLSIFPRGLDLRAYRPAQRDQTMTRRKQLHGDFTLLFAGRISEDKNLVLLRRIASQLAQKYGADINLVIAGDGPELEGLKRDMTNFRAVHFTGRLAPEELIEWYRSSDLFVFPSHTDTFGMVILEAQACGLPCLVTNSGGPKEIIKPGHTGQVIDTDDPRQWIETILCYRSIKLQQPAHFSAIRAHCREQVIRKNNWQALFDTVLGKECKYPAPAEINEAINTEEIPPVQAA